MGSHQRYGPKVNRHRHTQVSKQGRGALGERGAQDRRRKGLEEEGEEGGKLS